MAGVASQVQICILSQVHKVYLVKVEQEDPFRVDLEEVYSIDHEDRVLRKEVVNRTTNETDPTLITLRIRSVHSQANHVASTGGSLCYNAGLSPVFQGTNLDDVLIELSIHIAGRMGC